MFIWPAVLALSVAGSVGGMLTAAILLIVSPAIRTRVVPWLVSYAVGHAARGRACSDWRRRRWKHCRPSSVFGAMLGGILTFFVLEKLVLWRQRTTTTSATSTITVTLVILGDAIHTFVDGMVIAAAALVSLPLGATTALAVAAHEIPQEAGDFAILLAAGHSRARAFVLNLASAAGGLLGASAMLLFGAQAPGRFPTSSPSPPEISSTSRWRISSRRCTTAASTRTRPAS